MESVSKEKMKRKVPYLKLFLPRRRGSIAVRLALVSLVVAALRAAWWLADLTSEALLPPQPVLSLDHFAVNRNLKCYLDNITVLIEPSSTVCSASGRVEVLVLVTSSPQRFPQRQAIRRTWGKHLPTYFVLGLEGPTPDYLTADAYIEAKEYGDMIVFQFGDHYQNLTLKSALMMQWTAARCPSHLSELMLLKTDDDVLVNPWLLRRVVKHNSGHDLVGYRKVDGLVHHDARSKWYTPRWLLRAERLPEYLSGTGYLLRGSKLEQILQAAFETPIINLEDVYFTYIVSKLKLNLTLIHDHRLSPYKPWLPLGCVYWGLASTHSLTPNEILDAWPSIESLGEQYEHGYETCRNFVDNVWTELFLY